MSLRLSGEPVSSTAQRLVSHESWCFTRCIRRDLGSCTARSHLALNHNNLFIPFIHTNLHDAAQSPITFESPPLLYIMAPVDVRHPTLGLPASTNSCLSPPCVKSVHFLSTSTYGILCLAKGTHHCSRSMAVTSCIYVNQTVNPCNIMLLMAESWLLF